MNTYAVCIPCIETSGKGENVGQAKRVSFTGEESWRVLIHMDELAAMVCEKEGDLHTKNQYRGEEDLRVLRAVVR